MAPETDLMNAIRSFCQQFEDHIKILNCNCNSKKFMDFEAEIKWSENEWIILRCEAKVASQTDGGEYKEKFNTVHKIFGEILKGRNLKQDGYTNKDNIVYGFLIHSRDVGFYKNQYCRMINDWNIFGEVFKSKFVIVFDSTAMKLDFYQWKNFWIDGVLVRSFSNAK
ncbi:hypothetical protein [Brevibacillus choshinensis]|uniref:Uncharacterized protein n=1 Tax=Brevibacillus choshinensis TaxID=54911 RepID=A0ABX7FSE3_BRECH|nr:hypothetical protein [Brevibacillus choshinensis]QRG68624.1 hypothetical protein JNE38_05590 [Brevibacillus choshinensis]